ncbi:MAG: ral secretion pathway protein [Paucimonas sp.]|nr:ral secretion pathway protein [Paucimonas sp.]
MKQIKQQAIASNHRRRAQAFALVLAHLGLCLCPTVRAQAEVPALNGNSIRQGKAPAALPTERTAPMNGFAENLKPKSLRPAVLQNQPYQPIRKQDDQSQIPEIEMFVGESRVFPAPGVGRIAVGNGQIMSAAALDNKEVILFANAPGTSSLFLWNEDGRYQRVKINIVPGDTSRYAREIAAFLSTIPEARASVIGDKVIVEGDKLNDRDLAKIDELAKRYPQIVNFTDRLGWEQMVMLDVKVVEFPVDELRELGLKWSATGGAAAGAIWSPLHHGSQRGLQIGIQTGTNNQIPITNAGGGDTGIPLPAGLNLLSAVNLGLNAQLNLLAQNGRATMLAEPQLAARSGSKASFLAGGEFPYSVSNLNGVTIIFKPYGIKLDILPKVDRSGRIRASIESEVSKIDTSISTVGGPALLTRKTNTEFNVQSGETMVLSGLIQIDNSTNIDKVPLLGDIPVLGALFRSRRFQNRETELVVFVTPTVVDSRTPGLVDRIERTGERLQQNLDKPPPYLRQPLQPGRDPAQVDPAAASERAARDRLATTHATGDAAGTGQSSHRLADAGGSTLAIKLDGAVLREEPSHASRALMQLGRGALVQLGKRDPFPPGTLAWRHVVVGEIQGWVESAWLEPARLQPTLPPAPGAIANLDRQGALLDRGRPRTDAAPAARRVTADAPAQVAGRTPPLAPASAATATAAIGPAETATSAAARAKTSPAEVAPAAAAPTDAPPAETAPGKAEPAKVAPAAAAAEPAPAAAALAPATTAALASVPATPPQRFRVNLDGLALRVTPDINAALVERLPRNTIVEALPEPPQAYWLPVQANGRRGWTARQWLVPEH